MKPSHLSCPFAASMVFHLPWPVSSPYITINTLAPGQSLMFVMIRLLLCNWLLTFSKQPVHVSLNDAIQTRLLNKGHDKNGKALLKVNGKILVIRHSICRCVQAVMRLLKWLITLFVPYERNWFVAIRILWRLFHTETGLDRDCTLSDRGVRESPRDSRKMPNFSDVLKAD